MRSSLTLLQLSGSQDERSLTTCKKTWQQRFPKASYDWLHPYVQFNFFI